MIDIDPAIVVRSFIGMIIHHSLNNNLWDPQRRLLDLPNEKAAKYFTEILLNGIRSEGTTSKRQQKRNKENGRKLSNVSSRG